jgi:hypothetical protein
VPRPDRAFVEELFARLASRDYVARYRAAIYPALNFEERFQAAVAAGLWTDSDRADAYAAYDEVHLTGEVLSGPFAGALHESALAFTGQQRGRLASSLVILVPSPSFNGSVHRAPNGGDVVVVNHALIATLLLLVRCTIAVHDWNAAQPFCRDRSQSEYAAAIGGLANLVVSGDQRALAPHREALSFGSLSEFEQRSSQIAHLCELFILLHEFGHIVNGDLDAPDVFSIGSDTTTANWEAEFKADAYAATRLLNGSRDQLEPNDVALFAGIVLKFFAICERIGHGRPSSTHPPAPQRWERIKGHLGVQSTEVGLAANLDSMYAAIESRTFVDDPAGPSTGH